MGGCHLKDTLEMLKEGDAIRVHQVAEQLTESLQRGGKGERSMQGPHYLGGELSKKPNYEGHWVLLSAETCNSEISTLVRRLVREGGVEWGFKKPIRGAISGALSLRKPASPRRAPSCGGWCGAKLGPAACAQFGQRT